MIKCANKFWWLKKKKAILVVGTCISALMEKIMFYNKFINV